jgi:hypothetical protein
MENSFSRRKALGFGVAALAAPSFISRSSAAVTPVLVELFTSQGCSSCPPADKLAGVLRGRDDVVVVSLNVDYWDYIGWKDTLAKPEYTARQRAYALSRGDGQVYTPQMVFNGSDHAVGSQKGAVDSAISSAAPAVVPVNISVDGTSVTIGVDKGESAGDATVWLMSVTPAIIVQIERGENTGSAIEYHNVVRKLSRVGQWTGEKAQFKIPRKSFITGDSSFCIAVVQSGDVGRVVGLAKSPITQA